MMSEELEFRIAQYADGTLSAEEIAALETTLSGDAEARAMLESYRKLDAALKRELPLPAMDFDRLHRHLSDAVAERDRSMVTITLFPWKRAAGVAVAAMVLIAVGSILFRSSKPAVVEEVAIVNPPAATSAAPVVSVSGPAIQVAAAPVEEVSIGPSPVAQRQPLTYAASEDLIYRAPRVVIASAYAKPEDTASLWPF
jgi:anti-sigma-K factor RskA